VPTRVQYWKPKTKTRRASVRPNAAARGYCDSRHTAWRRAVLLRDNWQCRACGRLCARKREAHADHIIPVAQRPDLRYVLDNGQCLCASCHTRKTLVTG
jgi:predicted restriction endonuclease